MEKLIEYCEKQGWHVLDYHQCIEESPYQESFQVLTNLCTPKKSIGLMIGIYLRLDGNFEINPSVTTFDDMKELRRYADTLIAFINIIEGKWR